MQEQIPGPPPVNKKGGLTITRAVFEQRARALHEPIEPVDDDRMTPIYGRNWDLIGFQVETPAGTKQVWMSDEERFLANREDENMLLEVVHRCWNRAHHRPGNIPLPMPTPEGEFSDAMGDPMGADETVEGEMGGELTPITDEAGNITGFRVGPEDSNKQFKLTKHGSALINGDDPDAKAAALQSVYNRANGLPTDESVKEVIKNAQLQSGPAPPPAEPSEQSPPNEPAGEIEAAWGMDGADMFADTNKPQAQLDLSGIPPARPDPNLAGAVGQYQQTQTGMASRSVPGRELEYRGTQRSAQAMQRAGRGQMLR